MVFADKSKKYYHIEMLRFTQKGPKSRNTKAGGLKAESTTVSRGRQQQQEHQKTPKLSTNEDKNRNAGLM